MNCVFNYMNVLDQRVLLKIKKSFFLFSFFLKKKIIDSLDSIYFWYAIVISVLSDLIHTVIAITPRIKMFSQFPYRDE